MFSIIIKFVILLMFVRFCKYRPSNILSCGQWGYIGNNFNSVSFAMLGLYNQHRGVHSCGMFINNNITKGIKEEKLWMDFIAKNEIPKVLEDNKVCLGHARQASAGYNQHGWEQQHPFHIGNKIGQQNGSITNAYDLSKKYNIDKKEWTVDTELLYIILDRYGYDVLEEYEGSAALMWVHEDTPNELFIFKGASPYEKKDKDTYYVERPLHFLKEKDGIYFSSMENSLEAIRALNGDLNDSIETVPANQIMRIFFDKNDRLRTHIVKKVNRDLTQVYSHFKVNQQHYNQGRNYPGNALTHQRNLNQGQNQILGGQIGGKMGAIQNTANTETGATKINKAQKSSFNNLCITPEKCVDKYVTFQNGRYKCADKLVNGVFRISTLGKVIKAQKHDLVKPGVVYYFFAGVMIKDRETYLKFCKEPWNASSLSKGRLKKHRHYFRRCAFVAYSEPSWVEAMSEFSMFPIKVLPTNCHDDKYHQKWYHNGKECCNTVMKPTFTDKKYWIDKGDLIGLTAKSDDEEWGIIMPLNIMEMYHTECPSGSVSDKEDLNFGNCCETETTTEVVDAVGEEIEESEDNLIDRAFMPVWDKIFKTSPEALNAMRMEDIVTLHHYIFHIYNHDQPVKKDHAEIKMLVLSLINQAVINKESIRETAEELNSANLEVFSLLLKQLATKELDLKYAVVRALYHSELVDSFEALVEQDLRGINTKNDVEDVYDEEYDESFSEDEEVEMLVDDTLTNLKDCITTFDGLHDDLKTYPGVTILKELDDLTVKSKKELEDGLKQFVMSNCDASGKLINFK